MGMSLDDFCRCTPEEFRAINEAWHECRESQMRDDWERMRLLATIVIQPHTKKRISPEKLIPFVWDRRRGVRPEATKMTAAERLARFEKLTNSDCG